MRTRIGTQLIAGAGAVSALVIGVMAFVLIRAHTGALLKERTRSASQLSETIRQSTYHDMLENRRDNLHRQISEIGGMHGEGIRKVMGYYRAPEAAPRGSVQSLRRVAPCLLILRTQPGLAQALAVALDQGCLKHLGGSVSGYDTIFLAPTDAEHLDALEEEVRRFLGL